LLAFEQIGEALIYQRLKRCAVLRGVCFGLRVQVVVNVYLGCHDVMMS